MIQMMDVSSSILFGLMKDKNYMLQMINASISHEIKNPLNAFIA
jgi:signal transduction histidine kinase